MMEISWSVGLMMSQHWRLRWRKSAASQLLWSQRGSAVWKSIVVTLLITQVTIVSDFCTRWILKGFEKVCDEICSAH